MNPSQLTEISIAICNTIDHLRGDLPEPTRTALQTHLDSLLKEELRAPTGQAPEGDLTREFAEAEQTRAKSAALRQASADAMVAGMVLTPWYPDQSGDWVEGHPRDLPPETEMAGWLFMAERENKKYTIPERGWTAKELTNPNIVAYKVVKP